MFTDCIIGRHHREQQIKARMVRHGGLSWCKHLIKALVDWNSDALINFLAAFMLKHDPQERLSAAACLKTGSEIGLFDGMFQETGNATPKLGSGGHPTLASKREAPTIILGPLWQDQTGSGARDRSKTKATTVSFPPVPTDKKTEISSPRTT